MQLRCLSAFFFAAAIAAAGQFAISSSAQSPSSEKQAWLMQDSSTTASLRGIDSVDGQVAWASG
jgi:hypothetical protein